MKKSAKIILVISAGLVASAAAGELPRSSQELVEKLEEFEQIEKEKYETLIAEKREAVIKILSEQAAAETKKGQPRWSPFDP